MFSLSNSVIRLVEDHCRLHIGIMKLLCFVGKYAKIGTTHRTCAGRRKTYCVLPALGQKLIFKWWSNLKITLVGTGWGGGCKYNFDESLDTVRTLFHKQAETMKTNPRKDLSEAEGPVGDGAVCR